MCVITRDVTDEVHGKDMDDDAWQKLSCCFATAVLVVVAVIVAEDMN